MFLFNDDKIKTFIFNKKIFFKNKLYLADNQKEKMFWIYVFLGKKY
jgi:hypothetical protein